MFLWCSASLTSPASEVLSNWRLHRPGPVWQQSRLRWRSNSATSAASLGFNKEWSHSLNPVMQFRRFRLWSILATLSASDAVNWHLWQIPIVVSQAKRFRRWRAAATSFSPPTRPAPYDRIRRIRPGTSTGFDRGAYRQFAWPERFSMLRGRRPQGPQRNYAGSRSCCHQTIEKIRDTQESRTADKQTSRVSSYPPHSRADTSSVRAF